MRNYSLAFLTSRRCDAATAIRVAASQGYAFVGLRLWPYLPDAPFQQLVGDPQRLRETLAASRDTGVSVFDIEIIRIGARFQADTWDAVFETGAALGARAVLVAGDDTDPKRLADNYATLCTTLARYGMSADLEFMPWTSVPDARTALRVVQDAGSPPNAGILVDALHFGRSHSSLEDIRAIPRELLHYAQICDATAGTGFTHEQLIHTARCERLMPGEGNIDLPGLFAALPADLPISVEVVHLERERSIDPQEWAGRCLQASRSVLEPA